MKTLHLYLTRQVLVTLLMTVAVFTFVLLLGNILKEIMNLLVNRQVTLMIVIKAIALLIPFVLVFALPMGFLTATLLSFGRFSADNELTAARASGLSLLSLVTPVLLLSVMMSCLCALINTYAGPMCRVAYKELLDKEGVARLESFIPERTFIRDFKGFVAYFGRVEGEKLKDVLIYKLDPKGERVEQTVQAEEGTIKVDRQERKVLIHLANVRTTMSDGARHATYVEEANLDPIDLPQQPGGEISVTDMTFFQLIDRKHTLEKMGISASPIEVVIHSQLSFSFACIAFTLVGIPLGIRSHRRETSVGIAIALVLVTVYYCFIFLGQSLQTRPQYAPQLIVWIPNFLFQVGGGWLLWRANRGDV